MKMKIKRIILFLIIIYILLIYSNICIGENICNACQKKWGKKADKFDHSTLEVGEVIQVNASRLGENWHVEGDAGVVKLESQKTGEGGDWIVADGSADQKFGFSNDAKISVYGLKKR